MKKLLLTSVFILNTTPLAAQTTQEVAATCATLARMTERALAENRQYDVVLYVQTAQTLRSAVNTPTRCEKSYFDSVVSRNQNSFSMATTVIALTFVQPVPGWKHHEIQELIRLSEGKRLTNILTRPPVGRPGIDLTKTIEREQGKVDRSPER